MEKKNHSFDEIPNVLARIEQRLERIEKNLAISKDSDQSDMDYIGIKEACKILNFTTPTLYSKVCRREIPFYKKGNRLYFSKSELLEWIRQGKRKSANEINLEAQLIADDMLRGNRRAR